MSKSLSPKTQLPLMSFVVLQSFMNTLVVDVFGYLLPPCTRCFQQYFAAFPKASSPASRKKEQVHPLMHFSITSEFVADPVPLNHPEECEQPPVEFLPLSRHQHRGYIQ